MSGHLETVTRVNVTTLSLMLLVLGISGLVGTMLIAGFLKKGMYQTLIIIPLLMAAIAIGLIAFGARAAVVFMLLGF
jgi:predicted MFS family arabinose efflux permease